MFGLTNAQGPVTATGPSEPDKPAVDPFEWDDDRRRKWLDRIQKAEAKRREYEPWWDYALKIYSVQPGESPEKYATRIRSNRAFRNVHRKSAGLFYQKPDVSVAPSPLLEQLPQGSAMAAAHAAITNEKLSTDGADARGLAKRAVFDYLLCGVGFVKVGYRAYTATVEVDRPVIDPLTNMATIDPMTQQPVTERVPQQVIVKSDCFLEHASPKRFIIPADFDSTEFDKAPFLGMRFKMPLAEARRLLKLPDDWKPNSNQPTDNEHKFDHGIGTREPSTDEVCGTEVYYRSCIYRPDIVHPDHLTKLVLVDGRDEPAIHEDDPDQTLDPKTGKLTPDSRIGYPYCPLVIRVLTDSAYIMSDVAVITPSVNEIDKGRELRIVGRTINTLRGFYNAGKISEKDLDKLLTAPPSGLVGLPDEAYNDPMGPIRPMPAFTLPPDDSYTDTLLDNDLSQMMGIDATTSGASAQGAETATRTNFIQANLGAREGQEQADVADWYVRLVTKFSTLIQRYLSPEDAAAIVGQGVAQQWDAWRKAVPTRLAFTIEPDSSLKTDTPLHLKQLMDTFTYVANAPEVNRRYFLTKLFHRAHIDPSRALIPEANMPKPQPVPPKMSFSVKGEDLSPLSPQSPIVLEFLTQLGYKISPQAIENAAKLARMVEVAESVDTKLKDDAAAERRHGGKLPQLESLDKHQADETGAMQNTGELTPGMAGGMGVQ